MQFPIAFCAKLGTEVEIKAIIIIALFATTDILLSNVCIDGYNDTERIVER